MKTRFSLLSGLSALAAILFTAVAADAQVLFNNTNTGGVANGGLSPVFNVSRPMLITQLYTYHWNNGTGAAPGAIALRHQSGVTYGPFRAFATSGHNGRPNVNWTANMNVIIPAGAYTVIDSDPRTWSHNFQSGGRGFTTVRGTPASVTLPVPGPGRIPVPAPMPPDAGRNACGSPTLLSPLRSVPVQSINDSIGGADPEDYYQVSVTGFNGLNRTSGVGVFVSTSSPGVTLEVFTEQCRAQLGIQGPTAPSPKVIPLSLPPGIYVIRVSSTAALAPYMLYASIDATQ